MGRFDRQLAAAQRLYESAAEDDAQRDADRAEKRADTAAHALPPEPYADTYREWAGVDSRRLPFFPSNWQEGDSF